MTLPKTRRVAFTLVELLTVMFIIAVLAAISVVVARSGIRDSYTTTGAADSVTQRLLIARNRALRDRTPVGLRFIRDPQNPSYSRSFQFIEMPVLWAPNQNPDGHALSQTNPRPPFVVVRYVQDLNGMLQENTSNPTTVGVFVFGINIQAFDVKIGDLLRLGD